MRKRELRSVAALLSYLSRHDVIGLKFVRGFGHFIQRRRTERATREAQKDEEDKAQETPQPTQVIEATESSGTEVKPTFGKHDCEHWVTTHTRTHTHKHTGGEEITGRNA